ncbi:MAG: hypothetical protein WC637_20325, partial [Victivallales bacterium]
MKSSFTIYCLAFMLAASSAYAANPADPKAAKPAASQQPAAKPAASSVSAKAVADPNAGRGIFQTPIRDADLDPANFAEYVDGKEKKIVPVD